VNATASDNYAKETAKLFVSLYAWYYMPTSRGGVRSTRRGEFRPRQTRQLPRAVDLKGRLLSCQSY